MFYLRCCAGIYYVNFVISSYDNSGASDPFPGANGAGLVIINIYDDDIAKIPIPILDGEIQKDIAEKVQNSFALRRQSKQLLEYAKQAVEMAIEQGEDAALVWLKERSGE